MLLDSSFVEWRVRVGRDTFLRPLFETGEIQVQILISYPLWVSEVEMIYTPLSCLKEKQEKNVINNLTDSIIRMSGQDYKELG